MAETEEASLSCPICLISASDDDSSTTTSPNTSNGVKFLKTPCKHIFCQSCIEKVLLKPRQDVNSILTLAPCPMCRKPVLLFDLMTAVCNNDDGEESSPYAYDTSVLLPVANSQFELQSSRRGHIPEFALRDLVDKGVVKGCGIIFSFREPSSLELARPLKSFDNEGGIDSIVFDKVNFHQKSNVFHGKRTFSSSVCCNSSNLIDHGGAYSYTDLVCLLNFSDNGGYIRKVNLRWQYEVTSSREYPLDGQWEAQYTNGETTTIYVQRHYFTCYGTHYCITIGDDHCPHFTWPRVMGSVKQSSTQEISHCSISVGETLQWNTTERDYEIINWRRITTNLNGCWKVASIKAGNLVFRNKSSSNDQSLGPAYHSNALWGNTFCQGYIVGMASYHFLEPDDDGNLQAYISYESSSTEVWPSLDNGNPVPARVPFRNIEWDQNPRTFKGDICWEEDYQTTWTRAGLWQYEITFDSTFMFVVSGTVSSSVREPHKFGIDLIYINAAIATPLRETLQTSESTEEYLGVIRSWRDDKASSSTLDMLGEVAMSVMSELSLIDFNL